MSGLGDLKLWEMSYLAAHGVAWVGDFMIVPPSVWNSRADIWEKTGRYASTQRSLHAAVHWCEREMADRRRARKANDSEDR